MHPRETKLQVLKAVDDHWAGARYGPTIEELRKAVGLTSRSTVQFHINGLISDGYLSNTPKKRRSLQITPKGQMLLKVLTS